MQSRTRTRTIRKLSATAPKSAALLGTIGCWLGIVSAADLSLAPVVSGLDRPVYVTHSGDGTNRLFIVEQAGRILIWQSSSPVLTTFLDIRPRVLSGGELGLLGIAFHPNFEENRRFFVNYTRALPGEIRSVVAEYGASAQNPDSASPSERVLLEFNQPFSNHNGGHLAFGLDGYLYVGTGDGGSGGDPFGLAQNRNTLLGKILRIDVDGVFPFSIPPDNPFVGESGVRQEIWAFGLRNPWRFSFDRVTGELYAADVGQDLLEEVNLVVKGGNYGWDIMEGTHCFPPSESGCDTSGLVPPIAEYGRTEGRSVTGGYVYRGSRSTVFRGAYIFGDFETGRIFSLVRSGSSWIRSEQLRSGLSISSFGEDESGELYLVDYNGSILRLDFDQAQTSYFPQVADGSDGTIRLRSVLVLSNTGDDSDVVVEFFSRARESMVVDLGELGTGSRFQLFLRRGESTFLRTSGIGPLRAGYARLIAGSQVGGVILFSGSDAATGHVLYETGVPATSTLDQFSLFLDSLGDKDTGLALVYPDDDVPEAGQGSEAQLVLRLYDTSFNLLAEASISLLLGHHRAGFIWEFFAEVGEVADQAQEMQGLVTVDSNRPVAGLTLRTNRASSEDPRSTLTTFPIVPGRPDVAAAEADQGPE